MSFQTLLLQVLHPESRRSSTGDAFLCAAAAKTWRTPLSKKKKLKETKRGTHARFGSS